VLIATISFTTVLGVVSAIATVAAAVAALVAIRFARATVGESRAAREEADGYHEEEMRRRVPQLRWQRSSIEPKSMNSSSRRWPPRPSMRRP
jgi:hypothetical protein